MTVLPVFHYVDPSDVRKQKGPFEKAFVDHEEHFEEKRVSTWRDALSHVGNLAGCHLKNISPETHEIRCIVGQISRIVRNKFSDLTQGLVGIYPQAVKLESLLAVDRFDDVRFIGVWAMGGMGKSTLARLVYDEVLEEFEDSCFIYDVREVFEKYGLRALQKKLILKLLKENNLDYDDDHDLSIKIKTRLCHKRILLVLDDVNRLKQLEELAGEHTWFGPGSRIIITTRDKHLLETHLVDKIFEVTPMNEEDARRLFCLKAFKREHVLDEYLELSKGFLNYVDGLPLALEVLGSFLFGKSIVEWKSAFERLKEDPGRDITQVLQISFDGLCHSEKEIFLHIACFFNHEEKDYIVEILDSLDLFPMIGLRELIDKSLLKIYDNKLWMHDLLGGMGRNMVHQESPNEPGKRSRLWLYKDIDYVLKNNMGSEVVQAIDIKGAIDTRGIYHEEKEGCWRLQGSALLVTNIQGKEAVWKSDAFLKMPNLKFLRIHNICPQHVPKHLPNNLRFIEWSDYPLKLLLCFRLDELVQLRLQRSEGTKNFDKLKFIDLAGSSGLIISPDFTGVLNLENLVLARCSNLRQLHPSIGNLKKLILLNLEDCKELSCLPNKFEMESLETLNLSYCPKIKKVPEFVGNMKRLWKLLLECTTITELPSSIECLTSLNTLILEGCKNLLCLPITICSLTLIKKLNLSRCSKFDKLPKYLGNIVSLKNLDLSKTAIKELPLSIESLIGLDSLDLSDCKNFMFLPSTICCLKSLYYIYLGGCSKFVNLPDNIGNLEGLEVLSLEGTAIEMLPSSVGRLTALISLGLRDCKSLMCLPNTICSLKDFRSLDLSGCSKIVYLPKNLGNMKSLSILRLNATAIKKLPFSTIFLKRLPEVSFRRCQWPSSSFDLMRIRVKFLDLRDCHLLAIPNNICRIYHLNTLYLSGNDFVSLPESISHLVHLKWLELDGCKRLRSLPNLPSNVERVSVNNCTSLERLPEPENNFFGSFHFNLRFKCINCFKLADNIQSSGNLLQGRSGKLLAREILIPGSEIPSPLKEVKMCDEPCESIFTKKVKIQVPCFNGCDEWRGFLLCLVFEPGEHDLPSYVEVDSFEVDGRKGYLSADGFLVEESYCTFESNLLWLVYLPNPNMMSPHCGSIDAKGFHQVEIQIRTVRMEVEKMGFGLVYKEDPLQLQGAQ